MRVLARTEERAASGDELILAHFSLPFSFSLPLCSHRLIHPSSLCLVTSAVHLVHATHTLTQFAVDQRRDASRQQSDTAASQGSPPLLSPPSSAQLLSTTCVCSF